MRTNTDIKINGYTFYGRKREGGIGGGVGIIVRNDILHKTAPHISNRNLEIMWISVRRKNLPPLLIGTYYGKQESRTSKNEIEYEMMLLTEEIEDMKKEGEVVIAMDGNAKIGLLGEEVSRNGKLLLQVFENTNLKIMNRNEKCNGKITRKNTKNDEEISAIDFIVTSEEVEKWFTSITIDEEGLLKVKGRNETDHNTISLNLNINNIDGSKPTKKTEWNIRASAEKWALYRDELNKRCKKATEIITDPSKPIEQRYKQWFGEIETAARLTIGKTTFKETGNKKASKEIKELSNKKRILKKEIQSENDKEMKKQLIMEYKTLQEKILDKMTKEKTQSITHQFEKMMSDKSRNSFWREKKKMSKNSTLDSLIIKNNEGIRQFNPDSIKEEAAKYYENLYREKPIIPDPYHNEVKDKIVKYTADRQYENLEINRTPDIKEIHEIINNKANGKSTPDIKNEMLKRPGETMTKFIYPMIETIWNEEKIPKIWKKGKITSIWKGKGDKELLDNHRGITTSPAIGTILDTLIDDRIEKTVPFTQAQGGGKKGASTCDHLFIIRSIIDITIKEKKETYITFYDVSKAFDNADNDDMLSIMWDKGFRGKAWRILKNLSKDLTATIKTRFGLTREIAMEIGGKQGSRLTGRLFSKMIDILAEEFETSDEGFKMNNEFRLSILLWVDDVVSCANGIEEQKIMLKKINDFAVRHKLKWGNEKCKYMKVGKHKDEQNKWKIGEMEIQECISYKYLGDIISNDGKNLKNIEARKEKINASTITINTIAESDILNRIESAVLIELHEKVNIPGLLANCESWNLNKGETVEIERIETQAIKYLFDLPIHTPTPALLFTFGILYTESRIEQKQILYLHKILSRGQSHWTKMILETLKDKKTGWYKSMIEKLNKYGLETDFETIKSTTLNDWKRKVKNEIEKKNTERLKQELHKKDKESSTLKTKTASIAKHISEQSYYRKPQQEILGCTKHETKTLIIARYGMLQCGKNFKGSMSEFCDQCKILDDEDHRLNYCKKYIDINFYNAVKKVDFNMVYSRDMNELREILPRIGNVWNTRNAHGTMNN